MSRRDEILASVTQAPALPVSAAHILPLLQDPDVGVSELRRAIEFDPGLTSNLLHMANSAYFGGRGEIGNVQQAIVRLGLKRVFNVVMAALVAPMARHPVQGYDLSAGALLKQSVMTAIVTETMSEAFDIKIDPSSYAFTSGLLHGIGKIVLGTFVEVDVEAILQLAYQEKLPFHVAERQVLGIDHPEAGAALLEQWHLPAGIVNAVRWHKDPDCFDGDRLVVNLVHLASHLAGESGIGAGLDGQNYAAARSALEQFPLTPAKAELIVLNSVTSYEELVRHFPTKMEE